MAIYDDDFDIVDEYDSYAMRRSGPPLFLDPVCPWHLLLLTALKLEA